MKGSSTSASGFAPGRARVVERLLVAVLVVALAQVVRVLFPIMFEIGEDWDFLLAGLVALAGFSAPVLAILGRRLRPGHAVVVAASTVAVVLVVFRSVDPIPAWLAVAGVGAGLAGATLLIARSSLGSFDRAGALAPAVVVGLAADSALRAGFGSWDLAWQHSPTSLAATIVIAVVLVASAVLVGRDEPATTTTTAVSRSLWPRLGVYLMLQLLFLQNIGFVGSQAAVGYVPAVLTVLVGNLAALAAVRLVAGFSSGVTVAVALGAVVVAGVITTVSGVATVIFVVALQAWLGMFMARAVAVPPRPEPGVTATVLSVTGGSVLGLALLLLWSLDIDRPLPFPREALPMVAVLVVASAVVASRRTVVGDPGCFGIETLVVGVLAVVVPLVLWVTEPDRETVTAGSQVRLVDYNVRGAVGIDGQLAPDQVLDEIRSSDPDIVLLQEVARGWPIHGTMDLLAYLQRELAMDYIFVPAADGQFGNAILSRLPMTELDHASLPKDGTQTRSYAVAAIDVPGDDLVVAVAHTNSRSTVQVSALLAAIDTSSRVVLAGDMNIAPEDPEVALFTDAGLLDAVGVTGDPCRTTSAEPTSSCNRPDWLFVTPDLSVLHLRIGTGGASDHLAIHATLAT